MNIDELIGYAVEAEEKIFVLYKAFNKNNPGNANVLEYAKAGTNAWRAMEDIQSSINHLENIREKNV